MDLLKEFVSGKNLFSSPHTLSKHVANICDKLHVNSRTQVINIAHKKRWI